MSHRCAWYRSQGISPVMDLEQKLNSLKKYQKKLIPETTYWLLINKSASCSPGDMLARSNHGEDVVNVVSRLADVAPGQQAVVLDAVLHAVQLPEDVAHLDSGLEGGGIRPRVSLAKENSIAYLTRILTSRPVIESRY